MKLIIVIFLFQTLLNMMEAAHGSHRVLTLSANTFEEFRRRYLVPSALYDTRSCSLNACETLKIISQLFLLMKSSLKEETPVVIKKVDQGDKDWRVYSTLNEIEEQGLHLYKLVRQIESRLRSMEQPVWNLKVSNAQAWNLCTGSICHCNPEAKRFICWNKNLQTVPATQIIPLNMISIDLSYNSLSTLHKDTLRGLTLLDELVLSNNQLDFLPYDIFTDLDSLTRLRLQYNNLEDLDYRIFWKLRHLNTLDLSKNRLAITDGELFSFCPRLTVITLSDNKISSFPPALLKDLLVLEEFDVSHNSIKVLQTNNTLNLTKLVTLDFSWNVIENISNNFFSGLTSLRTLNLRNNQLTMLTGNTFSKLEQLLTLDLSRNQINQIKSNTFADLVNLRELFLDHNSLDHIPRGLFLNNKFLEHLTINSNNLISLNDSNFEDLGHLKHLMLHNNNIKYISQEALTPLRLLEKLRIDSNNMQYVPAGVFANLQYLVAIKLDKNPWHCDCRVLYLARWVREFPLKLWDAQPTCRGPGDLGGQEVGVMRYDDLCDGQWASMMSLSPRLPVRKNRITTPMNYSDYFNLYLKHIYTETPPNLLAESSSENETFIY